MTSTYWVGNLSSRSLNNSYSEYSCGAIDGNDNIIAGGSFQIPNTSNEQALLTKFSKSGVLLWSKYLNLDGSSTPISTYSAVESVAIGSSNQIYVAGEIGRPGIVGNYVAKFDTNGNQIWYRYYNAQNDLSSVIKTCVDSSGNSYTVDRRGNLYSLDTNGNFRWSKINFPDCFDLIVAGNELILVEFSYIIRLSLSGNITHAIRFNSGNRTRNVAYDGTRYIYAFVGGFGVAKIDLTNNSIVWRKNFTDSGFDHGYMSYFNNHVYLADTGAGDNQDAFFTAKITTDGNLSWSRVLEHINTDLYSWYNYSTQMLDVANNAFMLNGWASSINGSTEGVVARFPVDGYTQSPLGNYTYRNSSALITPSFHALVDASSDSLIDDTSTYLLPQNNPPYDYNFAFVSAGDFWTSVTIPTTINYMNYADIGGNTSNGGSNTSNTGSNTSNVIPGPSYGDTPQDVLNLASNLTFLQGGSVVYNNGPNIANANTIGVVMYYDEPNNYMDIYGLVNSANIELPMKKFEVGEKIWVANSNTFFNYSNYKEILYLYPPETFTIDGTDDTGSNNDLISDISNYCCSQNNTSNLIRDSFGNLYEPVTIDTRCYGFKANDVIWQDRSDGKRVRAIVAKEDCVNTAIYVANSTGLFEKDRIIYKDNGSLSANVWAVFANTTGKITLPKSYIISMPDYGPGPNRATPPISIYIDTLSDGNIGTTDEYFLVPNIILDPYNVPIGNIQEVFANTEVSYNAAVMKVTNLVNNQNNKIIDIIATGKTNSRFTIGVNGNMSIAYTPNSSTSNVVFSLGVANSNIRSFVIANTNTAQSRTNTVINGTLHTKSYAEDVRYIRTIGGILNLNLENASSFIISTDGTQISTINLIKPSYNANVAFSTTLVFAGSARVLPTAWSNANVQWPNGLKPNVANTPVISLLNTSDSNIWYGFSGTTFVFSNTGAGGGLGPGGIGQNFLWYNPAVSYTFTVKSSWTSVQGTDLDTRTWITSPFTSPAWSNVVLGWDYESNVYVGTPPSNVAQSYITFSGDDTTSSGTETVVIPIDTIIASDPAFYLGQGTIITGYSNTYTYSNTSYTSITGNIVGRAAMTEQFNSYMDDSSISVATPFPIQWLRGNTYSNIFIGSNGYWTFGSGSGSTGEPTTLNRLQFMVGDRALWWAGTLTTGSAPNRVFRVRTEYNTFYPSGNPPVNFIEMVFYENKPFYYDLNVERYDIGTTTFAAKTSTNDTIVSGSMSANNSYRIYLGNETLTSTPIFGTGYTNPYIDIHTGAFWYDTKGTGTFNFEIKNDITGSKIGLLANAEHRSIVGTGRNEFATFRLYFQYLNLIQIM